MQHSLNKSERIKSKKIFECLFRQGKSLFYYPLKLVYVPLTENDQPPLLFGISVPKRLHKKAAVRNRIKRLVRESFRRNKPWLLDRLDKSGKYALLYIYLAKEEESYHTVDLSIKKLNRKWIKIEASSANGDC